MSETEGFNIQENWDNATAAAKAKLEEKYKRDQEEYAKQGKKADQEFRGAKNQATVTKAMQERARREQMANMGMSGGGGTSRTFAQRNSNNLNNQIGSISQQQRDYTENVNATLANLRTQYDAEGNAIEAQNNASSMNAQIQYDQWKKQMEMQQANTAFEHAWAMYKAKKITRKQFEAISGVDI